MRSDLAKMRYLLKARDFISPISCIGRHSSKKHIGSDTQSLSTKNIDVVFSLTRAEIARGAVRLSFAKLCRFWERFWFLLIVATYSYLVASIELIEFVSSPKASCCSDPEACMI